MLIAMMLQFAITTSEWGRIFCLNPRNDALLAQDVQPPGWAWHEGPSPSRASNAGACGRGQDAEAGWL